MPTIRMTILKKMKTINAGKGMEKQLLHIVDWNVI
jgi:hypothetical protein